MQFGADAHDHRGMLSGRGFPAQEDFHQCGESLRIGPHPGNEAVGMPAGAVGKKFRFDVHGRQ
jgi:hypothetical protein